MNDIEKLIIAKGQDADHPKLTEIAFAAKRSWNYPEDYYEFWKVELTITKDYINQNVVYKVQVNNKSVGFYSIVNNESDYMSGGVLIQKGYWLEHFFILPEYQGKGIGRLLIEHAKLVSKELGIEELFIFVDPFAKAFYEKTGARFLYDSKSSIPGRMIPVYGFEI